MRITAIFLVVVIVQTESLAQASGPNLTLYAECKVKENSGSPPHPISGTIYFKQSAGSLAVAVTGTLDGFNTTDNITQHGFHIHKYTNTSLSCLAGAGLHFNPHEAFHGAATNIISNRHVGDLGNIDETAGSSTIKINKMDEIIQLNPGERSIAGKVLVIHANRDDLGLGASSSSKLGGNAGAIIGCCIVSDITTDATSYSDRITAAGPTLLFEIFTAIILTRILTR